MAKKSTNKKKQKKTKKVQNHSSILLFTIGSLILSIAFIEGDLYWFEAHKILLGLFGWCAFLLGLVLIRSSVTTAPNKPENIVATKIWQVILFILLLGTITNIFILKDIEENTFVTAVKTCYKSGVNNGGGMLAGVIAWALLRCCGLWGAGIIVAILTLSLTMLIFNLTVIDIARAVKKVLKFLSEAKDKTHKETESQTENVEKEDSSQLKDIEVGETEYSNNGLQEEPPKIIGAELAETKDETEQFENSTNFYEPYKVNEDLYDDKLESSNEIKDSCNDPDTSETENNKIAETSDENASCLENDYQKPSIELLKKAKSSNVKRQNEELNSTANKLIETLKNFGVGASIKEVSCGPSVTRYELQPSVGVKISKITNLADDITLNLATAGVRIEAPIPNKSAIGIEVPNKTTEVVNIREVIDSEKFKKNGSNLTVALGKDISGDISIADLAKMPHLLIAGSTGSGKSVCINSIIISLIYKASPDDVKLLMIDPKVVELGVYNGIPHLLTPVVTDPKKAAGVLGYAVTEMLRRYKLFAENSVRDFKRYNEQAKSDPKFKKLPQIVVIIDELADLMMVAPNDVEDSICRLAQMARAAGMHLVIATQRPSVDVITGIIKANIPSRIAFAVSSGVDSRTIIDSSGAERLLGRGDMLFLPIGINKPMRIQGCFVSDFEIEQVIKCIKSKAEVKYDENIVKEIEKHVIEHVIKDKPARNSIENLNENGDKLLEDAIRYVVETGQVSTSLLQRKFKVGYSRAARIIDEMEERGIVSGSSGSNKPRKVTMTKTDWIEWQNRKEA